MATTQKRGDGYRITVSCGYDLTGKQIRRTTTWKPEPGMTARQIEKELARQAVLFEEKCKTGQVLDGNVKLADFAERWFTEYAEKQLRPTTVAGYRKMMPRINAAMGHIRLDHLQPHHLMHFYSNLSEAGVRCVTRWRAGVGLRDWLNAQGMTQKAFAQLSGVSAAKLSGLLRGGALYEQNARKIAQTVGQPLESLFEPVEPEGKLSGNTVQHYHRLLSTILSTAVKWQVIFSNPCERVAPPKMQRKEASYLDEAQAARLLEALEDAPEEYRVMVTLLLYTGLRRGELCGLVWSDIDFDAGLLTVARSSLYVPGKGIFEDDTKNQTSRRVLKLPDGVTAMLKAYHIHQRQRRLQLGDQWHECGRLFTTWNGQPIHPDTLTTWFSGFVKRNGLPPVTLHSLRHTNATLLIAAGVNVKTVSAHLGHSTIATTGNIYAHAIQSAEAAAAEALENKLPISRRRQA